MKLSYSEMKKMNEIQLEIFARFADACEQLNLKYYFIHGSLLGALRYSGFFPYDDDIDVAMPREDYDILMSKGQNYFPEGFFVQSCTTEKEYPLPFAKIRNTNTAFIQPILKNCNVNKGIYVDVFPIDVYPESKLKQKWLQLADRFYMLRINADLHDIKKVPAHKRMVFNIVKVIYPSWEKAVHKRAFLYCGNKKKSNQIVITGGKAVDRGIPAEWFQGTRTEKFEKMDVLCPARTEEYLEHIYGDYLHYDPSEKYMEGEYVNVSAEQFSTTVSYKDLL